MLTFPVSGYCQVVEISVARELLFRIGCGARRLDGDNLAVYKTAPNGFYVSSKDDTVERIATLSVDEGRWSQAMHKYGLLFETVCFNIDTYSFEWNEYVDFVDLLRVCVLKLNPIAKIAGTAMIGRGSRQQHFCDEYRRILTSGSWAQVKFT